MLNPERFKAQESFWYSRLERKFPRSGEINPNRDPEKSSWVVGKVLLQAYGWQFSMHQLKDRRQDGQFQQVSMSATNGPQPMGGDGDRLGCSAAWD